MDRTIERSRLYRALASGHAGRKIVIDLRESQSVALFRRVSRRLPLSSNLDRILAAGVSLAAGVAGTLYSRPVRVASAGLLGYAGTTLALDWTVLSPTARGAWLAVCVAAGVGLGVGATAGDLADSRTGAVLHILLSAPASADESDDGPDRSR